MSGSRECVRCRILKPVTDFPLANWGRKAKNFRPSYYLKDARDFVCRECKKQLAIRSIYENRRVKRLEAGGWQCAACGEITHPTRNRCNRCKAYYSGINY